MNELLSRLSSQLAGLFEALPEFRGATVWKVSKANLVDLAGKLRDHPEAPFQLLIDLTAVDLSPINGTIEIVYHLGSTKDPTILRLKVPLQANDPTVPSVSHLWKSAVWLEREVFDLFGVRFSGNPDLRRLLMPDDYEGHPLLKEHPLCPQEDCDDF